MKITNEYKGIFTTDSKNLTKSSITSEDWTTSIFANKPEPKETFKEKLLFFKEPTIIFALLVAAGAIYFMFHVANMKCMLFNGI